MLGVGVAQVASGQGLVTPPGGGVGSRLLPTSLGGYWHSLSSSVAVALRPLLRASQYGPGSISVVVVGAQKRLWTSLGSISPHFAALWVGSVSLDLPHSKGVDVRWGLSGPSVSSEVFVAADSPAAARVCGTPVS